MKRVEFRTKYHDDRGIIQRVTKGKYYDDDRRTLLIEHVENLPQRYKLKPHAREAVENTITIYMPYALLHVVYLSAISEIEDLFKETRND